MGTKLVNIEDLDLMLYVLQYVFEEKLMSDETLEDVKELLEKY